MGYSVYEDQDARDYGVVRWAGYGVPAICDDPNCNVEIDRGLGYKCETRYVEDDEGEETEEKGCGLYFCGDHLHVGCRTEHDTYTPKPDTAEWEHWILTDDSWEQWRAEHLDEVAEMTKRQQQSPVDA